MPEPSLSLRPDPSSIKPDDMCFFLFILTYFKDVYHSFQILYFSYNINIKDHSKKFQRKIAIETVLFSTHNICLVENTKNNFSLRTLIWGPVGLMSVYEKG